MYTQRFVNCASGNAGGNGPAEIPPGLPSVMHRGSSSSWRGNINDGRTRGSGHEERGQRGTGDGRRRFSRGASPLGSTEFTGSPCTYSYKSVDPPPKTKG